MLFTAPIVALKYFFLKFKILIGKIKLSDNYKYLCLYGQVLTERQKLFRQAAKNMILVS